MGTLFICLQEAYCLRHILSRPYLVQGGGIPILLGGAPFTGLEWVTPLATGLTGGTPPSPGCRPDWRTPPSPDCRPDWRTPPPRYRPDGGIPLPRKGPGDQKLVTPPPPPLGQTRL